MNPRDLPTLERFTWGVLLEFGPPGWALTAPRFSVAGNVLSLFGALPQTMHFGSLSVTLDEGRATFVDQDHRDGGDYVERELVLPDAWRERLAELAGPPGPGV